MGFGRHSNRNIFPGVVELEIHCSYFVAFRASKVISVGFLSFTEFFFCLLCQGLALQAQRTGGTRYTANAVPGNAGYRQPPETPGRPGRPPQVASSLRVHTLRPGVRLGSGSSSSLDTASRFRFVNTTQPLSPSPPAWIVPRMPPDWPGQVLQGEAVSVPSQGEAPGARPPLEG